MELDRRNFLKGALATGAVAAAGADSLLAARLRLIPALPTAPIRRRAEKPSTRGK